MSRLKIMFAFALGFLAASFIGPAVPNLGAQKGKGNGQDLSQQIDKAILQNLNQRLYKLESIDCSALGKRKVVAPFEVDDSNGKKIFYVDNNATGVFDSNGQPAAVIQAFPEGGLFVAKGGNSTVFMGANDSRSVRGIGMTEGGQVKLALGKSLKTGSYSLRFLGPGDKAIAGIGVAANGAGVAGVGDASGEQRANIGVNSDGIGIMTVFRQGSHVVASLSEGDHHGGRLLLCSAGGCEPPMVAAGDEGGYGLVAAGPKYFEPGGPLGLPGSFIIGKRQ